VKRYDHKKIEKKWQGVWQKNKTYEASDKSKKKNFYALMEFPYPSGDGLHVGHIRGFTAMDIVSRKRRMEGYNVLYPIGWDAFGLPTENFAIKTGKDPAVITKQNTDNFRKQFKSLGISFDWSREINTTDPKYYKWTQWLFLQFLKHDLAYKARIPINWCPKDKIGLANEEVVTRSTSSGQVGVCERCGTPVEKREKEQWMLAITKYADKLYKDLDDVDFLEKIKVQQRNWIGKSDGAEIEFPTSKKYKYVFLHGFEGNPNKGKYLWLKKELESRGHTVVAPTLPNINNPIEKEQVQTALEATDYDENTILWGHSLGSVVAMKVLEKISKPIAGVVLSGAFIDPEFEDGLDVPFKDTFKWEFNVKKIKENSGFINIIHDINDDRVSINQCERLEKMINVTASKVIANKPHFDADKEPEILKALSPSIKVFTTRPDTIYGATYLVLSPEHPFVTELINGNDSAVNNKDEVVRYIVQSKKKTEIERTAENKEKTGVELRGVRAINPANNEEIPVWIADYVLAHYGTGAIMAVPADDKRDLEFAKKFDLAIIENYKKAGFEDFGKKITRFKLRDWVFSRQRYWGEPIPVVHCEKCGTVPVPESELPVKLPKVKNYEPTDTGESPLSSISSWVNTKCPKCKGKAKRETDTMPNWAGSSWYFLRYIDPKNSKVFADKKKLKQWMPIDWYNGGMEHTTLHLLYSRFWNKFLFDHDLVPVSEPYKKRTSHGLILAEGGEKMSKSRGNVVNPDQIVKDHGADSLRLYEMFIGPFDQPVAWSKDGIVGPVRFLEKVWRLSNKVNTKITSVEDTNIETLLHKTIQKVTNDIETINFNTAVSALMIFINELDKQDTVVKSHFEVFLKLIAPFAPHIAEEIWMNLGNKKTIHLSEWPKFDPKKIVENTTTIMLQINGKVRASFIQERDIDDESTISRAINMPEAKKWIGDSPIKKTIVVKNRLVNFVI